MEKTISLLVIDEDIEKAKGLLGALTGSFKDNGFEIIKKNYSGNYSKIIKKYIDSYPDLVLINGEMRCLNTETAAKQLRMIDAVGVKKNPEIVAYYRDCQNGLKANNHINKVVSLKTSSDISDFVAGYINEKLNEQ